MAAYSKRRPDPLVIFHTKKERDFGIGSDYSAPFPTFPTNHLVRINTSNRMGDPSGTFSIDLVYYKQNPGEVEPYYYDKIRPLDLVEIELERGITTMIGIVDKVQKSTVIQNKNVRRSVNITGRSLGAIWEFDLIKYFTNALGLSDDLAHKNLLLQQGAITFDFYDQPPYNAVLEVYAHLPALTIELWKGKKNDDFIDVGTELFVRRDELVFARGISPYAGSVWDYFKTYIQEPINELWTDSKDGKLFLRSRPTPFSHGKYDPEKAESALGEPRTISWHDTRNWIDDEEPYHEISLSDLREEQISRLHGGAYSVFAVLSSDKFTGADAEYATFHPLVDSKLVEEIGTRDMQISLNYIPLVGDGETTDGSIERYTHYRNKLYLWNRDNHRMQSGTMTVKGNPNIRVGDRVYRPDLDTEFYVQAVSNSWAFGQPFTTQMTVDRGLSREHRDDMYKAGMDFLKGIK